MTTKIVSKYEAPDHVTIGRAATWSGVYVGTAAMGERTGTVVDRAEFLRAVETELNVVVINRADLPDVETGANDFIRASTGPGFVSTHATHDTPDTIRRVALGWLAIAEHLEAHPPVDRAGVRPPKAD